MLKERSLTSRSLLAIASLLICLLCKAAQAQTYSDSTFNTSNWTCNVLFPISTTGATATCSPNIIDGKLQPSRQTIHNWPTSGISQTQIFVAHLEINSFYDPATQGAIGSLSYSYDARHYNPPAGQAVAYSVLIFQNGSYYRSTVDSVLVDAWTNFSRTLAAVDFTLVSGEGPKSPDFSCKGSRIQLGYMTTNSTPAGGGTGLSTTRTSGIDNWKVTINNPTPCCGTISKPQVTCDKGVFTFTFVVTNNSNQGAQYLLLSAPAGATYTVSPNSINFGSTPLNPGSSTTVSLTIGDASPGQNVCVNVALADNTVRICCTVQTCIDLPDCNCLKPLRDNVLCAGQGSYTYTISLQNLTGVTIQQIFVIPTSPSTLNVSPQLFTFPPLGLSNLSTTTQTITISGAPGGTKVCLQFSPLGDKTETCCSMKRCFLLPVCGPPPAR